MVPSYLPHALSPPRVHRFLALSQDYLLHAKIGVDPRGRPCIEWRGTPAPDARANPPAPTAFQRDKQDD
jgi:hypothetical protein